MPDQTNSSPVAFKDLDMMTKLKYLIEALRGGNAPAASTASSQMPSQLDGYRLHVQEAKAQGETPLSYGDWIKQQPSLSEPQE